MGYFVGNGPHLVDEKLQSLRRKKLIDKDQYIQRYKKEGHIRNAPSGIIVSQRNKHTSCFTFELHGSVQGMIYEKRKSRPLSIGFQTEN